MKRIFVVGAPRSGTTLAQALVASHPALVTFPETHFFTGLQPRWQLAQWLGLASKEVEAKLEDLASRLGRDRRGTCLSIRTARSATKEFVSLVDEYAQNQGVNGWVEKTPAHLHWIRMIERYVPKPRFCHVLRRGPEVVASLHEVTRRNPEVWGGPRSLDRCARRWLEDVEISLRYVEQPYHAHIQYNQVTQDPETVIQDVWDVLGLPQTSLDDEEFSNASRSAVPDDAPWQRVGDSVEQDRGGKFQEALTTEQQDRVLRNLRQQGELHRLYYQGRPLFK